MRIHVEKLVYGGAGIARTDQGVVFVDGVLPDEAVEVEIIDRRKDYARARLTRILEPSPDRREPSCPNFETVGCCNWDHIGLERQRDLKESILRESLARLGDIDWDQPIERTPSPERGYRLRASFRIESGEPCFLSRETGKPVPVRECKSLMPQLNGFLDDVRGALRQRKLAAATGVDVIASPDTGEVDAVFRNGRTRLRWLGRYPIATVGGLQYRLRPGHFFQPNRFLLEPLMSTVAEESGAGALALDLFCGSGFFSLPLARRHRRVVGVERRSVANAEWNARRNRFQNVDFVKAPAWAYLKTARIRPDALVLNPPRAGAGRAVIQGIAGLGPRRIVYVSCNPTTLAPEARRLLDSGYRLTRLRFVDQFPNTHHIETIALFEAA